MKKKLLSLTLALALCLGLTVPAIAADEEAPDFGAKTSASEIAGFTLDGIKITKSSNAADRAKFEAATGLTLFSQKEVFTVGEPSEGAAGITVEYFGLKNSAGTVVFPAEFTSMEYIGENRIVANRVDKTRKEELLNCWLELGLGVYTTGGTELFPPSAASIAFANQDKRTFLITPKEGNGKTVDTSSTVNSGQLMQQIFYLKTCVGLYDWDFKELLSPKTYAIINYIDDGYYRIQEGHADADGTCYWSYGVYKYGVGVVIPCQREIGISYLGSDMFRVRTAPFCYCAIDGTGKQVLPAIYAGIRSYSDGYFTVAIPRSEQYRQRAIQENSPSASYDVRHGAGDMSDTEAYLTMGIVDSHGTAYSSFDHDLAYIGEDGRAYLKKWNGGHEKYYPYSDVAGWDQIFYIVKSYDTETISLSSPTPTGRTITDILRERGITTNGTSTSSTPVNSTVGGFTDVKESDYFADAVQWAVEKKITSGTSKTTFSPGATCNRAQILSFLWRASGSPEPTAANPFSDTKSTDYFYKAALWAAEKGMVSGSSFGASAPCTRASTMEYMWKAAGSPAASYNGKFDDVSTSADYAQAVAWAVENKVTAGTSKTTFGPDSTCTRGQIVTFLYRAFAK